MGGPGDPWNLQQLALGSPFKCFQLWQGVRENLHCKSLKTKNKKQNKQIKKNLEKKKKAKWSKMAFRSLATNL